MRYSKLVLPGLAIIAVSYGLARFSFGLFLPDIAQSLNMTSSTSGIISSLFYVSYCITIIYSTIYSTKYGPKSIIIAAGISALIGLISIGLAPNAWILAFGVIMAGSSTGLISPPFGLAISLWISAHRQSSANTWINSGTSIGLVFAGLSTMVLPVEWRNVYLIYALIAIVVTVWNYINLPQFDRDTNIYRVVQLQRCKRYKNTVHCVTSARKFQQRHIGHFQNLTLNLCKHTVIQHYQCFGY